MKQQWKQVQPFVRGTGGVITESVPPLGEDVLIWHPVYGVDIAQRKSDDSFWDGHGNEVSLGSPIKWWMPLPGQPEE